jgi:hypothetical protein
LAKRLRLWIAGAVAVLVAGGGASVLAMSELRAELLLKVSPKAFRDAEFLRFTNGGGGELYLLGTIHGDHLTTPGYSLWNLGAVVTHLHPDRLLVEERPEQVARGHLGDGPVEMPFAALTARAAGAEVRGIDWWTMQSHAVDPPEREDHIFANVTDGLTGGHRIMVLTGFSHVDAVAPRLVTLGWRPAPFADADKEALFDTTGAPSTFPPGMTEAIRLRIADEQADLAAVPDSFWKARIADVIASRQALLATIAKTGERPG